MAGFSLTSGRALNEFASPPHDAPASGEGGFSKMTNATQNIAFTIEEKHDRPSIVRRLKSYKVIDALMAELLFRFARQAREGRLVVILRAAMLMMLPRALGFMPCPSMK